MFKYLSGKLPHSLDNFYRFTSSIHSYGTRQSNILYTYVHKFRLHIQVNFSLRFVEGTKIWNSLPLEIRLIYNISNFKKYLKMFKFNALHHYCVYRFNFDACLPGILFHSKYDLVCLTIH